jgi:3D (Asp-Asp-Asp) domain-containing protein
MNKFLRAILCLVLVLAFGMVSIPQVMAYGSNFKPGEATYSIEKIDTPPFVDSSVERTDEYPFSFNLNSVDGSFAVVSFSSKSEVQSFTIEQMDSKNVISPSNDQLELLVDTTYSFEVIYQEKESTTIYNGQITPALTSLDIDETVILEISHIVKNIINNISTNTLNAAGTIYELEDNGTYSTADRTYNDYDNYGAISSTSDIDWWVVSFSSASDVNFWLGNIPSGCDYDLKLYSSNGTTLLASSSNGSNQAELITYYVSGSTNYYVRINSYSGSSSSQYLFRAKAIPTITIQQIETVIPQNISAVSRTLPNTDSNACYDYSSSFRPYSGWESIDYTNSSGKVGTLPDRVLRQMKILVTVKNGTTPVSGATVSLSTSLGTDAYIYTPSTMTNSSGQLTAYIEFYSNRVFTATASYNGATKNYTASGYTAVYKNKFYMTVYNFPLRSNFSTWANFEAAVQLNGTGYDDVGNQWYKYNPSGSILPISGPNNTSSGTTPTEYRTIAVDSPYITRRSYISDGSSTTTYHRGRVIIDGLSSVSGDSGYRTAEDSGSKINGYHIDLFIGFKTIAQFSSAYGSYVAKSSGYYFPQLTYSSTFKGTV